MTAAAMIVCVDFVATREDASWALGEENVLYVLL